VVVVVNSSLSSPGLGILLEPLLHPCNWLCLQQLLSPLVLPCLCATLITAEQGAAPKLSYHPRQKKADSWPALFLGFFSVEIWNFQETIHFKKYRTAYLNV